MSVGARYDTIRCELAALLGPYCLLQPAPPRPAPTRSFDVPTNTGIPAARRSTHSGAPWGRQGSTRWQRCARPGPARPGPCPARLGSAQAAQPGSAGRLTGSTYYRPGKDGNLVTSHVGVHPVCFMLREYNWVNSVVVDSTGAGALLALLAHTGPALHTAMLAACFRNQGERKGHNRDFIVCSSACKALHCLLFRPIERGDVGAHP